MSGKEKCKWQRKVLFTNGRLMRNDKKIMLYHLSEKMNDFLRPKTAEKIIKIQVYFAAL